MDFIYIIGLFIFTLLFRSLVRIIFPNFIAFDTYFHLFMVDFIRKNGINSMIEYKRFIKPFGLSYPWMVHWILSVFPKKFDSFLERFFNPFLDALFVVVLYLISYYLTNSNEKSLMLCLLYVFTPATFSILGTGPRIKSFTPRLFGEVVGSLAFIFEFLYLESFEPLFLIIAVFFASLGFLASKFTVQALVFINIPLILLTQNFELSLIVFIGLFLAVLYSKGKYVDILKQQLGHLKWYFIQNLKGKMAISERNSLKKIIHILRTGNLRASLKFMFFDNSYFIVLYKIPILFVLLWLLMSKNQVLTNIDYFVLSGGIVFLISSLKWFLFIGEAERYLNYILFFICLDFILLNEMEFISYALIAYGFIYYLLDFALLYQSGTGKKSNNDLLIDWLCFCDEKLNIATIPHALGGWRVTVDTQHNFLYGLVFIDENDREIYTNFMRVYPFLDISKSKELIQEYNLDYIFYDKKALDKKFGNTYKIPSNLKQIQISENIFALYK